MALQGNHQNKAEYGSKNQHAPIYESGEGGGIVGSQTLSTPSRKWPAAQLTHDRRAEHAAITHSRNHPRDEDQPK